MKTILIDSDVCLDVYMNREPFYDNSAELLDYIDKGVFDGIVSTLALANLYYILRKYETKSKTVEHLNVLRSYTQIGTINSKIFDKALKSGWNDLEDAVQHFCAVEAECDVIVTRNVQDYKRSEIPIFTPSQFLHSHQTDF